MSIKKEKHLVGGRNSFSPSPLDLEEKILIKQSIIFFDHHIDQKLYVERVEFIALFDFKMLMLIRMEMWWWGEATCSIQNWWLINQSIEIEVRVREKEKENRILYEILFSIRIIACWLFYRTDWLIDSSDHRKFQSYNTLKILGIKNTIKLGKSRWSNKIDWISPPLLSLALTLYCLAEDIFFHSIHCNWIRRIFFFLNFNIEWRSKRKRNENNQWKRRNEWESNRKEKKKPKRTHQHSFIVHLISFGFFILEFFFFLIRIHKSRFWSSLDRKSGQKKKQT